MSITADRLRAGMYLVADVAYIRVERVIDDAHGMLTAFIRNAAGDVAPVRFHGAEHLTVGV